VLYSKRLELLPGDLRGSDKTVSKGAYMSQTESLRMQHTELLGLVSELSRELDPASLRRNASNAHGMLQLFTERLKFHLNMEDRLFYPKLLSLDDGNVKSTAQRYIDEMGGLLEAYGEFLEKWGSPEKIQARPDGFVSDINGIFAALGKRIDKENNELYPLLDNL
jgi:hemerythrin-like domain-containing protein